MANPIEDAIAVEIPRTAPQKTAAFRLSTERCVTCEKTRYLSSQTSLIHHQPVVRLCHPFT
jgi:hypothetical protein